MFIKRLGIVMLVAALAAAALLSGCGTMQDYIDGLMQTDEPTATPLPALPTGTGQALTTPVIPIDVVMNPVEYTTPMISADGSKILYRHMTQYSDNVMVQDRITGREEAVNWPRELNGIPYFYFAPDSETILFFADNRGDEHQGLYTSDIESGSSRTILPAGENDCYYVADNPANEKEIFIMLFDFDSELYDLYRINYETGEKQLILKNPDDMTGVDFDSLGNLRVVERIDEDAGSHVWLKKDIGNSNTRFAADEWTEILSWDYEDGKTSGVFGFMADNERLIYMDSSRSDTGTLCIYDTRTGQIEDVFSDPGYELSGSWTDLELNKVVAVQVYRDKPAWEILDESFQDDYDELASLSTGVFNIVGSSVDDHYWVVEYISDVKQSDYYIYDMQTKTAKFLFNESDALEEYEFAPKEPISFVSSDGLQIEGYATFPVGAQRENLPMVVLVHGGPWARDVWGYDYEVQFLANRGYLVLQVNFRGSTGYGKDFLLAGDKEWGRNMHQDILDGVNYAIAMGWADPDRVGVYGASYGGYEALICAAFSSDVFQCAVDAFGPSSLLTFVDSIPPQWSVMYQDMIRSIGDPETEADLMRTRSPLYYVQDITIPMLIAQGENDIRVVQNESDQMVAALEEAGVPVTYMLFPNTGHGFSSYESRLQFYTEMEQFFAEYLGGRTE